MFVSWKLDPDALFIDAFSRPWQELNLYAFPPCSVVGRCINKIKQEKEQGDNPSTLASTNMVSNCTPNDDLHTRATPDSIHLPYTNKKHPLHKTLQLMACQLSGDPLKGEEYHYVIMEGINSVAVSMLY